MKDLPVKLSHVIVSVSLLLVLSAYSRAQNPVSLSMSVSPAKVKAGGKLTARVTASIGGGWHMYSITQGAGGPIPTRITVPEGIFRSAGGVSGSAPKREMDPNFGIMTEFYAGSASFSVPVLVDPSAQPGVQALTINVRYQVCNDTLCLPPKTVKVSAPVEIAGGEAAAQVTTTGSPTPAPKAAEAIANANAEQDAVAGSSNSNAAAGTTDMNANADAETEAAALTEKAQEPPADPSPASEQNGTDQAAAADFSQTINESDGLWAFILLAMATGALTLLTPCVFPMIPITVSYFTNHAAGDRGGAVRDALVYALGIILTFTALGVTLALVFGAAGINNFASSPYVNIVIAGVFIAFALSLFGAYELGIPSSLMTRLDAYARGKESGKFVGILLMGFVFSLTSFTCTAPFVGTLLVMAAQGDWAYPILGMLAFSTVFALPFFALALAPQLVSQLPRSGGWLNSVKVVMGFLEIAAAMKFISNVDLVLQWGIFTREVVLASWVAVALMITFYLLGKFQLFHDSRPERLGAARVMVAFMFLSLGLYLLTGLFGARLGEIESFLPPMAENAASTRFASGNRMPGGELDWITNDYAAALEKAKKENKPVFIDFTGYTCTNCRWMEANMFPRPAVTRELEKYVLVRLYTDGEGEPYAGFQRMQEEQFRTVALPLYAVVKPDGGSITTFPGLTRSEGEFISFLRSGHSKFIATVERTSADNN